MRRLILLAVFAALPLNAKADDLNLRTGPVDWVLGANGRLDYRLAESWTVGLSLFYMDTDVYTMKVTGLTTAFLAAYSWGPAFGDAWMVEGGASYGILVADAHASDGDTYSARVPDARAILMGGYHWFWGPFNLTLAGGGAFSSAGNTYVYDTRGSTVGKVPISTVGFTGDVTVGVAF